MAYCRKCGKELSPEDKFCTNCGNKTGAKALAGSKSQVIKKEEHAISQPVKSGPSIKNTLGILLAIALGFAIFYAIGGFEPIGDNFVCLEQIGKTLCGYCPVNETTNGTAHAGKCRYCPMGDSCSGDICGDLKCSDGGSSNYADQCPSGYCLSGAHCCPSSERYYCNGGCYSSASEASNAGCSSVSAFC